jgi:hypothetical protein
MPCVIILLDGIVRFGNNEIMLLLVVSRGLLHYAGALFAPQPVKAEVVLNDCLVDCGQAARARGMCFAA